MTLEGFEFRKSDEKLYSGFTILIPTWNNLPYLQLCLHSLELHSQLKHQIVIVVNEGKDGTIEWVKDQTSYDYLYARENIGICHGLNNASLLASTDFMFYSNDDMYLLPGWDISLKEEINKLGHRAFMLSATMIEPRYTANACVVVKDYGTDFSSFREEELVKEFEKLKRQDWNGSTWPPNLIHIEYWKKVGGLSVEYSPGMYSDPDLAMKLFREGVRTFIGKGDSLVYHFGSKSTAKLKKNKGRLTFLKKWKMTARTFYQYYLRMGQEVQVPLSEPAIPFLERCINQLKVLVNR